MEEVGIQVDKVYETYCRVRNTFIEMIPTPPKLARSSSEPKSLKYTSLQYIESPVVSARDLAQRDAQVMFPSYGSLPRVLDGCDDQEAEGHATNFCVMVRDVPCKVNVERMAIELEMLGFGGCYDSMAFPKKGKRGKATGVGYGFIRFKSEDAASLFLSKFTNYRFNGIGSKKCARAVWANAQGSGRRVCHSKKKKPISGVSD
eukprot:TRINITY_DN3586_c0_g1_i2.p1 TRINITY_DN3586_c0_g1~~TRINITY_DN3586_c0_g1_i2.p1  ORF type:complete len:203 (-),score=33.83 TRINITY_DN3586_c0_g1_i2:267-875(-)